MNLTSKLLSELLGNSIMTRPDKHEYFLEIASVVAKRSTCARRKVGCVLVDKYDQILATGYNGVAKGLPHCIDEPCPGAALPSGTGLNTCQALHSEANALIQCRAINDIVTCYTTVSPCNNCIRMLLNTPCQLIVFSELYPHMDALDLWVSQGRHWIHIGDVL